MDVLINLIVVNISQYHIVHFRYIKFFCQLYFNKAGVGEEYGVSDFIKFEEVTTELPKCIKNSLSIKNSIALKYL